mmetsp:Transcript_6450/g.12342  ORF Transcript_6450/g.12342 Transcript_6450/m.12342 type:complete len:238 (+) Transcript_6450:504-1217(+)
MRLAKANKARPAPNTPAKRQSAANIVCTPNNALQGVPLLPNPNPHRLRSRSRSCQRSTRILPCLSITLPTPCRFFRSSQLLRSAQRRQPLQADAAEVGERAQGGRWEGYWEDLAPLPSRLRPHVVVVVVVIVVVVVVVAVAVSISVVSSPLHLRRNNQRRERPLRPQRAPVFPGLLPGHAPSSEPGRRRLLAVRVDVGESRLCSRHGSSVGRGLRRRGVRLYHGAHVPRGRHRYDTG